MNSTARWITLVALFALSPPAAAQDAGKRAIELPVEQAIGRAVTTPGENPRVAPGVVRWHADLAGARVASARSGKPVLLFQLLGRLDEEFC